MMTIPNKISLKNHTEFREVSDLKHFSFIELIACYNTDDLVLVPCSILYAIMLRKLSKHFAIQDKNKSKYIDHADHLLSFASQP